VNAPAVRLDRVAKRFMIPRTQRTTLRVVRALLRREGLRRELWALQDVSFAIAPGERLALIGRNGCGKTTLLRLLSGILAPTSGTIALASPPRALFSTAIGFSQELTVADNVFLFGAIHGLVRHRLAPRQEEIIARAGITHLMHAPLKDLSMGQVQRLALSVFAETSERFLIFDEVLGNVDRGFARTADGYFRALAQSGRTLVMTSHDPAFLGAYCDRAIWIDAGRVHLDGPFDDVMRAYERSFDDDPPVPPAATNDAADATPAAAATPETVRDETPVAAPAPAPARAGTGDTSR
jgi:ABC-type polysaccharide/polyol phosphate transport system ATPase subunit